MSTWTEDRTKQLLNEVGNDRPVSQTVAAAAATVLEVSTRSISAKLRKMGVDVEKVGARVRLFSDEQEAALEAFLSANDSEYTYAEIASQFSGGEFSSKQVQGKILSMELTSTVKATPKKEVEKKYSDEEEVTFVAMANAGKYLEDIAEALNKTLASVRGKALSLNRTEQISEIPSQKESHAVNKVDVIAGLIEDGSIANLTVAEIAGLSDKSERGVKTIITRRGTACANYKAKVKAKAA